MTITNKQVPWDYSEVRGLFSPTEINLLSPYIDVVSKRGSVNITNDEGVFKMFRIRIETLLNELKLEEPYTYELSITKQNSDLRIITTTKMMMMFFDITPFKEPTPFMILNNNDYSESHAVFEGFITSKNNQHKPYKFHTHENKDLITLNVNIISGETKLPLKESTTSQITPKEGVLIYKNEFAIFTKFKCGSSSVEKWSKKFKEEDIIDNTRNCVKINDDTIHNVKEKVFLIRDPFDRFFSGLLQTKVLGAYDVYKSRRTKDGEYYTVPFDEISKDEILKTIGLTIKYNPSFLFDAHIKPYLEMYKNYIETNRNHNIRVVELKNLSSLLGEYGSHFGLGPNNERIDMRGETYDHLDKSTIKKEFFDLIYRHKSKDVFKLLINELEKENEAYRILTTWT